MGDGKLSDRLAIAVTSLPFISQLSALGDYIIARRAIG
jgi:hypothetical protein